MADGPPGYLRVLFEHYDNLSAKALDRWQQASQEIEDREYGPTELLSDSLYLWSQFALGMWAPLLAGNPMAVPRLRLSVPKGQDAGERTFVMALPGSNAPATADLKQLGGSKSIPQAKVKATPQDSRTKLKVGVTGLNAESLSAEEVYEGIVTLDGRVIAIVRVEIDPAGS